MKLFFCLIQTKFEIFWSTKKTFKFYRKNEVNIKISRIAWLIKSKLVLFEDVHDDERINVYQITLMSYRANNYSDLSRGHKSCTKWAHIHKWR